MLHGQGGDQFVEVAVEHGIETVERQIDAVVGDAALREIVGADALRAVAGADLTFAVCGNLGVLRRHLSV